MSRYRPPQPASSKYITAAGKEKMQQEYDYLWKEKRPAVTQSVREAAAQGDRSENAEYIYGKKQLREIDSRLRFLKKRLDIVQVVDQVPDDQSRVFFGAYVSIEDSDKEIKTFQIVGADEFDLKSNKISIDSPLARALLNKSIDDEVCFQGPASMLEYIITDIKYHN